MEASEYWNDLGVLKGFMAIVRDRESQDVDQYPATFNLPSNPPSYPNFITDTTVVGGQHLSTVLSTVL
jgi:hypothetical protein